MSRQQQRGGSNKLPAWKNKVFKLAKDMQDCKDADKACDMLSCIIAQKDKLDAIFTLVEEKSMGTEVIKSVMHLVAGNDIKLLLNFFDFLGSNELNIGSGKNLVALCYDIACVTPGLLRELDSSTPNLDHNQKLVVAWFLVQICKKDSDMRENDTVVSIAEKLATAKGDAIQAMINVILPQHQAAGTSTVHPAQAMQSLDQIRSLVPEHDNDFPTDYRKIAIIPTADEINRAQVSTALVKIAQPEAALLDRQFRLLRQDMMGPILEEVRSLAGAAAQTADASAKGTPNPNARALTNQRKRLFPLPVMVDISMPQNGPACLTMLVPMPERLKSMAPGDRAAFLEGSGRRVLSKDALILFLTDTFETTFVARIIRRGDSKELLQYPGYLCVGVEFSAADLPRVLETTRFGSLQRMKQHNDDAHAAANNKDNKNKKKEKIEDGDKNTKNEEKQSKKEETPSFLFEKEESFAAHLFQASSSVFSYEPILESLQEMVEVPFREELVLRQPPLLLSRTTGGPLLPDVVAEALQEDPNQRAAVQAALQNRLCLIQGPPGTGKTYVGVQIVRAVLANAAAAGEDVRILCLCYTNHALDDFLLSLHKDGCLPLEWMVRLGSSPKIHEKINERRLDALGKSVFDRYQSKQYGILVSKLDGLKESVNTLKSELQKAQHWDMSWESAQKMFCNEYLDDEGDEMQAAWAELAPEASGGFTAAKPGFAWDAWCSGKPSPFRTAGLSTTSIWRLDLSQRRTKLEHWRAMYCTYLANTLADEMMNYQRVTEDLSLLKSEGKVPKAKEAKVLGCTTTSAAKNRELLEQIRPTMVLIEEAGEILEANVLTSLGPSVRHCVMIGDHQQLRPKLESYDLRKESGKNVDFDVSLFERLALQPGFPMITLNEQRRMRPEICDLIRLTTYPQLKDHDSVCRHDPVRGVRGNVIFIDHNQKEGDDQDNALLGTSSKVNLHEAAMVREIVHYLTQQHYKGDEMVVLTPYLGQLVLLQAELKKLRLRVDINDLDRQELQNADVDLDETKGDKAGSESAQTPGVRVSTVDNFQGEEARIVIASLVRCNDRGEVGFVAGAERVNVLLSRARDGLILIGSATTLRSTRKRPGNADWAKILDHLQQRGSVHRGFPALCQTHNEPPEQLLDAPEKFKLCCPNGGCNRQCGAKMPMCPLGHLCTKLCHPVIDPTTNADMHATMKCDIPVHETCKNGHDIERVCSASQAKRCTVKVSVPCASGKHTVSQLCSDVGVKNCFACTQEAKQRARLAEKMAAAVEKQEARVAEERAELAQLSEQLQLVTQQREHAETVAGLQHEQDVMKRELVAQKEATRKPRAAAKRSIEQQVKAAEAAVNNLNLSTPQVTAQKGRTSRSAPVSGEKAPPVPGPVTATEDRWPAGALSSEQSSGGASKGSQSRAAQGSPAKLRNDAATGLKGADPRLDTTISGAGGPDRTPATAATSSAPYAPLHSPPSGQKAPAPRANAGASTASTGINAVTALLELAAREQWMKIVTHPAVAAASQAHQNASSKQQMQPIDELCDVTVRAFNLLAEEKGNPPSDPTRHCKEADTLQDQFKAASEQIPSGTDSDLTIHSLQALLFFVTFVLYKRHPDLPYTARDAGRSYITMVQVLSRGGQSAQKLVFPATWETEVHSFDPAKIKGAKPPAQATKMRSEAEQAWQVRVKEFKAKGGKSLTMGKPASTPSEAGDSMMTMTGLEEVKTFFVDLYDRMEIAKVQGRSPTSANYNLRCDGNPGTGKTTVARLYSKFLIDMGVLPEDSTMKETSGSKLISDGVRGLTTTLEEMKEAGGGVVFVDETYQLNPDKDQSGRQVLDFILPLAERLEGPYGKIVWVFAGYADKMDKLYEHNPGLPSRFPNKLTFADYTDEELLTIMQSLMARGGQDVAAAQPSQSKGKPAQKTKSVPVASNNGIYGGYGYNNNPDQVDQWGNTWTWKANQYTYVDPYGNISGYGPVGGPALGTATNPIVNQKTGQSWLYNPSKKAFYLQNDPSKEQSWYPGSPKPPPAPTAVRPFTAVDVKWVRVAVKRLGRMRGKVGFGNARAVRNLFDKTLQRQARRLTEMRRRGESCDVMQFTRDDLLGPKANKESLVGNCTAWKELQAMIGLDEVKKEMSKLIDLAVINADLEDQELPLRGVVLNRIFLGNPGTGKTTVANLYGQILVHLGLLSKGDVVYKTASDFVGNVIGGSETATRSILAASEGCVLVIDEAYSLNPAKSNGGSGAGGTQDPYRAGVIDTIVEQVQGRPGEDRAVVMLGYRKEMEDLLAAANPGLSRRFQLENAFNFADYTDEQLVTILLKKCKEQQLDIDLATAGFAVTQLAKARALPNFGNAGAVENLLSAAKLQMGSRRHLICEDFCPGGVLPKESGDEAAIFADLVADDNILQYLKGLQASVKLADKRGRDRKEGVQYNLLFVGAPGTGKTTVARLMGKVYHSLRLLPTAEVEEAKAADLIAPYVGQSQKKASEVLHRAKGKVLFIDEAYQLNPVKGGQFMQEAVDTLVQELTSEELKGQLIVILAGYDKDIEEMLSINAGLKSRFSKKIHFANFTPDRVEQLLRRKLADFGLFLSVEADAYLPTIAAQLCTIPLFSNGRDADTLANEIRDAFALRALDDDGVYYVEAQDLQTALRAISETRNGCAPDFAAQAPRLPVPPMPMAYQTQHAPPPLQAATATRMNQQSAMDMSVQDDVAEEFQEELQMDTLEASSNSFGPDSNGRFGQELQRLLDQRGLNNKEGVARLAALDLNHPEMVALAKEIAKVLNIDLDGALDLLRDWQAKQKDVNDKLKEEQKERALAMKQKRKAMVPIWRCAVCGRADLNYIFCYVSPYIVRYDQIDV